MTDEEKLKELIAEVERVLPYVMATLPMRGIARSAVTTSDPGWVAVHAGRANSAYNQLANLLLKAEEFRGLPAMEIITEETQPTFNLVKEAPTHTHSFSWVDGNRLCVQCFLTEEEAKA